MSAKHQLRVIAGTLKGRRLGGPAWAGLRPTSDRLRETLFNVLAGTVAGARVLDAYAGTGAVGIEALSRGASHVTFVERDRRALELIADNLARCGIRGGYTVMRGDLSADAPSSLAPVFDLVFLDPPYAVSPDAALAPLSALLAPGGRLIVEHARRAATPERVRQLVRSRTIPAGDSALTFYVADSEAVA